MHNKKIHMLTFGLLVVGGVNWLLVALGFNLVDWIFIDLIGVEVLATAVYILVGLSAVYEVVIHKRTCVHCGADRTSGGRSTSGADAENSMGMRPPGAGV